MYTQHNLMFMQFNSSSIDFGCFTPRTDKYRLEFVAPGVGTGGHRLEFVVTAIYYITEHCSGTSAVTTTADPQTTTEYFLHAHVRAKNRYTIGCNSY